MVLLKIAARRSATRPAVSHAFPAEPGSVGAARRALGGTLAAWDLAALHETATLLISELATNAVLHARTGFLLHLAVRQDRLRVTVADQSPTLPRRRQHGLQAGTGRGLALVEALSADHGLATPFHGYAKGVWFELPADGTEPVCPDEGAIYGQDWLALLAEG